MLGDRFSRCDPRKSSLFWYSIEATEWRLPHIHLSPEWLLYSGVLRWISVGSRENQEVERLMHLKDCLGPCLTLPQPFTKLQLVLSRAQ